MYLLGKHGSHRLCIHWFTPPVLAPASEPHGYTQTGPLRCSDCRILSRLLPGDITLFVAVILGFIFMALAHQQTGYWLLVGLRKELGLSINLQQPQHTWIFSLYSPCCDNTPPLSLSCSRFWGSRRTQQSANRERRKELPRLLPCLVPARKGETCFCSPLNYCSPAHKIKTRSFSSCPKFLGVLFLELVKLQCWWDWYFCFACWTNIKNYAPTGRGNQ